MAKDGRPSSLARACALVASLLFPLGFPLALSAAPEDDPDRAIAATLAVQVAMQQGREHMLNGKYKAAVETLEAHIARINGNRAYLLLLRDAYRAYIQELRSAKKDAEAKVYIQRLELLDSTPKNEAKVPAAPKPPDKEPARSDRVVRAEKEDDPFNPRNDPIKQREAEAENYSRLLEQADKEYVAKHFEAALRAYEKVRRTEAFATTAPQDLNPPEYGERYAYCILHRVVGQLKEAPASGASFEELENQVNDAKLLAKGNPQMVDFAQEVLGQVHDRRARGPASNQPSGDGAVRHLAKSPDGWQVAESANFRVLHNQSRTMAEDVARVAERTRIDTQKKWFGETGDNWKSPCEIHLYATAQEYARATGESETSPGHCNLSSDGAVRQIHLHCDDANLLTVVLPHEATHAVLSGQFGDKHLPRWADEGMAVLTEPREKIDRYLARLPDFARQQQLFTVRQLLQQEDWPDARKITAFYAQSVSFVGFLSEKNSPQAFTKFLRESRRLGYEKALQQVYGFKDLNELEQEWRRYAFRDTAKPAAGGLAERKP